MSLHPPDFGYFLPSNGSQTSNTCNSWTRWAKNVVLVLAVLLEIYSFHFQHQNHLPATCVGQERELRTLCKTITSKHRPYTVSPFASSDCTGTRFWCEERTECISRSTTNTTMTYLAHLVLEVHALEVWLLGDGENPKIMWIQAHDHFSRNHAAESFCKVYNLLE